MNTPNDLVHARGNTPLGPVLLAATSQGIAGLWFDGQRHHPDDTRTWPAAPCRHALMARALGQLAEYFAGERAEFDLPLDLARGTSFQQQVWHALRGVPRGTTLSYGALAQRVGMPAAVRAVGAAVGRNPVSVLVPCHRIVGAAGQLTGYAGGLPRKAALLALEGAAHPAWGRAAARL
jgi:methylated-DNA-[protein]-cysteine S-methyltransferase